MFLCLKLWGETVLALCIYTLKEWRKTLKKWIGNAVVKYDYIYYDVYT